ncbi:putative ferric-chelate reductase 1 [Plectropomus leopardus]|uniref:putative ferric-chelate reductase 1 n=1 Tax=Plectropomus leopardus TaxID=160734 RepID=UPI001C4BEEA7|nr:putative ferric-chelate reductase 1 [Plectropomus leopardus]
MPNTTVTALMTNINRTGCGSAKLCAADPADCTPGNAGCFLASADQISGQNFNFELAGETEGYLAAALSTDSSLGGNDTTYVCANNNGTVKFIGAVLNNGMLTMTEQRVNSVKGSIRGNLIQCTFAATVPNSSTRTTRFSIGILNGTFNSTSGALGNASTRFQSGILDLSNPGANVTNINHAAAFKQSLTQALLITFGVLGLVML